MWIEWSSHMSYNTIVYFYGNIVPHVGKGHHMENLPYVSLFWQEQLIDSLLQSR